MKAAVMESVLGARDDAAVFERAQSLGFAGVEVELERGDFRTPGRLEILRHSKERSGLEIPSVALVGHLDGGLADADPHVAQTAAEEVRTAVGWAAELGSDVILVPFFARGELTSEAEVERCETAFRSLCPLAAERGVTLCYEGLLPAARVRLLAERIGSAAFGCYLDLANPLRRGLDTATEIRTLGELIRRVHVKDQRVGSGDCPPGLGLVD
ncbi:MAG: sugar phosphate isomerase/epimerase family protein, partial [Gaiellaceae bacterium]